MPIYSEPNRLDSEPYNHLSAEPVLHGVWSLATQFASWNEAIPRFTEAGVRGVDTAGKSSFTEAEIWGAAKTGDWLTFVTKTCWLNTSTIPELLIWITKVCVSRYFLNLKWIRTFYNLSSVSNKRLILLEVSRVLHGEVPTSTMSCESITAFISLRSDLTLLQQLQD